jgi:UrcA family protein
MKASMKRYALIGMAMLAATLSAHLASAAQPDEGQVRQAVVSFSDLDLSQSKDMKRFYRRVKHAARQVCDNSPGSDLKLQKEYEMCMSKAMNDAFSQVKSVQLAGAHRTDAGL